MNAKKSSAYLLFGDSFLCEDKWKFLRSQIEKEHSKGEVLFSSFQVPEINLDDILLQARSLPFLIKHQIFLIRGAEELKEKNLDGLRAYLDHPREQTTLIFEVNSGAKDHPLKKTIEEKKSGELFIFEDSQKRRAGEAFIKTKLRQYGKSILPQASNRLMEKMGDHPMLLQSVLEQLASYSSDQEMIDETMVETFEERFEDLDSFKLTDAIGNKNPEKSLLLLRKLLEDSESDISALIGMLHWQFKRYWKAAVLMESGQGQESALRECRISPKQAPFFLKQMRFFSRKKLENVLESLFHLDLKLKTGQTEGVSALEAWILETTRS